MPTATDLITLSSDFGWPYPAAMKGVLLTRTDGARLVDISHEFPRQDVRAAAFWLREVLPWFPPAVHLVVIDPGVGTDRAAIVIRAGDHALVGPDNGVLLPAAEALAGDGNGIDVFEIIGAEPASSTFHGRDVFAPAAAVVHRQGIGELPGLDELAARSTYESIEFPSPSVGEERAKGEVLVVDGFGNVITNLPGDILEGRMNGTVEVNGEMIPVGRSYAAVESGQRLVTIGSHENVELAVNRGRGDEGFELRPEDRVTLSW